MKSQRTICCESFVKSICVCCFEHLQLLMTTGIEEMSSECFTLTSYEFSLLVCIVSLFSQTFCISKKKMQINEYNTKIASFAWVSFFSIIEYFCQIYSNSTVGLYTISLLLLILGYLLQEII